MTKAIREMDMAVDEVARAKPLHQQQQSTKAAMGVIGAVVNAKRRRMGQQDIKIAAIAQPVKQ